MSKKEIAEIIAEETGVQKTVIVKIIDQLATLASTELERNNVFTIPGICRVQMRQKPATWGGDRIMFGRKIEVKPKPAQAVFKASAISTLKKAISSRSQVA